MRSSLTTVSTRSFQNFWRASRIPIRILSGHDVGVGAQHSLPLHGQFYANYNRASSDSNYFSNAGQNTSAYNYTDDIENAGASFHPTKKLTLNVNENYTSNLSGYLAQSLETERRRRPSI